MILTRFAFVISGLVVGAVDYSCVHQNSWILNDGTTNKHFKSIVDIKSSIFDPSGFWSTTFDSIPNYNHLFTSDDISFLNSRPKSDFAAGHATSAVAGKTYEWGSNIGYKTLSCSLGYWPPGPSCPTAQNNRFVASLRPAPETMQGIVS